MRPHKTAFLGLLSIFFSAPPAVAQRGPVTELPPPRAPLTQAEKGLPLPVVVELFLSGDKSDPAALAFFNGLKSAYARENLVMLAHPLDREKGAAIETMKYRHASFRMARRMPMDKAPLLVVDGTFAVDLKKNTKESFADALLQARKKKRQLVSADATLRGDKLKVAVYADHVRRLSDNCRICALVSSVVQPQSEPVVKQVIDYGYLNDGHKGASTMTVPLDPSWYKADRDRQLSVVAYIYNTFTGDVVGAARCQVVKQKDGWF